MDSLPATSGSPKSSPALEPRLNEINPRAHRPAVDYSKTIAQHTEIVRYSSSAARPICKQASAMSSQSLSKADRSFENQFPSVCLHTDKVTCSLTNWPISWQP